MKRISLLPLLFCLAIATAAETPETKQAEGQEDLFPAAIPEDVRYTKPDLADAKSAREKLAKEYLQEGEGLPAKSPLIICHRTWARIEKLGLIKPETGIKMEGISPQGVKVEGRSYRDAAEINIVWKFLRELLRSKADTKVRTPNRKEMSDYWAQIGWDIKDAPLFVVEHGQERFLFAFTKDEPFQVCDLSVPKKASKAEDAGKDATSPEPKPEGSTK